MATQYQAPFTTPMVTLRRTLGRQVWTDRISWDQVPARVKKYLFDQHEYREFVGGVEQVWTH